MVSKRKKTNSKVEFSDIVWCIDNLDSKQLAAHDKLPLTSEQIIEQQSKMIELDFKLSAKWDTYSKSFLATAICDNASATNSGLAISARSDDYLDAWSILLFKFFTIANEDLRPFADSIPRGIRG